MIGIIIVYLVLVHTGAGMLASLLLVSPRHLDERFFRFNATIALALVALAELAHRFYRARVGDRPVRESIAQWQSRLDAAEPWLWGVVALALLYLATLPFRRRWLGRTLLAASVASGAGLLGVISLGLESRAIPQSLGAVLYPLDFSLSALALGSVFICMILGHWYLVQPGMSIRPLQIMAGLFIAVVSARVLLGVCTTVLVWRDLSMAGSELLSSVLFVNVIFFSQRVLFGLVLPLALSWMIWQTVKIRSTQSATGILYVAVVFIMFGEFLSRYILVSMGYPV